MLEPNLIARFTTHLRGALQKALQFTIQHGRDLVEPGDLLVGLLQEPGSIGAEILGKLQIKPEAAEEAFRGLTQPRIPGQPVAPDLSPVVKKILEKSVLTAHIYEHRYIGTEHLLFALFETPFPDLKSFFTAQGLPLEKAKEQVLQVLKSTAKFPHLLSEQEDEEEGGLEGPALDRENDLRPRPPHARSPRALEVFTRDLTSPEVVITLDPVIGRDAEIERLIQILCRRTKNNPILLGDPGVGKTAIVEGLAQRIVSGAAPYPLQGKKVLALDLTLLVAGTMYRGEFEARLKQLVEEIKAEKNIILFIDEIHTIVGAGSTSGSLDAANILKPALARGEIRCLGATTWQEYKKHIEPDAALERRYQTVDIREPSPELTRKMLQGLKSRYEDYHRVRFRPEALDAAVFLAGRHLTDRFFPDKAIDLLDEAAALSAATQSGQSEFLERRRSLEVAIQAMKETRDQAVKNQDMEKAAEAREDQERLEKEKTALDQELDKQRSKLRVSIGPEQIAGVVASMAQIPLSHILADERTSLLELEKHLGETILGQPGAVREAAEIIRRARLGLQDPHRPKASMLFVGPSGVGKTELAKTLAREIFGSEEACVKLDMSEFSESHAVSKLLGSPAGYVGFREGSRLADAIRRHPHAVLVFDEFEKAHPDVQHVLLQALEDGRITEATGRPLSLTHAYIVLTSNIGADWLHRSHIGFGQSDPSSQKRAYETLVREELKERFRPELLHRLDRVIVFHSLDAATQKTLLRRELETLFSRVTEGEVLACQVSDEVVDWLLKKEPIYEEGARAIRRLVQQEIADIVSQTLIRQPQKRKWKLVMEKTKLKLA